MSDIVDKAPSLRMVCMILRFAADHCGKVMLLSGGFFSWLVFNMIWVPPETPTMVSRSSSRTSRGRLPLGVVLGSSSFCAGSANSSERPMLMFANACISSLGYLWYFLHVLQVSQIGGPPLALPYGSICCIKSFVELFCVLLWDVAHF